MTKAKKTSKPKAKSTIKETTAAAFKRYVSMALTNALAAIQALQGKQNDLADRVARLAHSMAVRDRDTIEMDKKLTEAIGGGVWRTAGGYSRGIAFLSDSHLKNILDGGFAPAKTAALIRAEQARRDEDDRWALKFGTASQRVRIAALERKVEALSRPQPVHVSEQRCQFDFRNLPSPSAARIALLEELAGLAVQAQKLEDLEARAPRSMTMERQRKEDRRQIRCERRRLLHLLSLEA